jgi:hypothetical protein
MEILIKKIHAKTNMLACGTDVYLAAIIVVHALGKNVPWYLWALFALEFVCAIVVASAFKLKHGTAITAS